MWRSREFLLVALGFVATAGCGGSGKGKQTPADAGLPDSRSTVSDAAASDPLPPGSDASAPDAVISTPDAAGTDAPADGPGDTPPDRGGSDALEPPLDARGPDVTMPHTDAGDALEVGDAGHDGGAPDAADAGADRPASDAADAGADTLRADVAVWDPDGGTRKDEIVRACAKAASCASQPTLYSASRCIQELGKTASRHDDTKIDRLLACASAPPKGAFCSDFTSCWGGGLFTLAPFVEGGTCNGSYLEITPPGASTSQAVNCATMGGACESLATSVRSATCNLISCSGDRLPRTCAGTTVKGCGEWLEYTSLDCAWSGRTCRSDLPHAVCAGAGAACSDSDRVTCAGSVATYCSGGALATVDCAKTGSATRCAAGAPSTEPCTAAGTECNPASFVETCDGNRLRVCADGSLVSVECHDIGLVLCFQPSSGPAKCMPGV